MERQFRNIETLSFENRNIFCNRLLEKAPEHVSNMSQTSIKDTCPEPEKEVFTCKHMLPAKACPACSSEKEVGCKCECHDSSTVKWFVKYCHKCVDRHISIPHPKKEVENNDWRCECKCSLGHPNDKECPCHPKIKEIETLIFVNGTGNEKRFTDKINELVEAINIINSKGR